VQLKGGPVAIIDTKEKYLARYAKRGQRMARRTRTSDRVTERIGLISTGELIGHGSKPCHEDRFANMADCFPPIGNKSL